MLTYEKTDNPRKVVKIALDLETLKFLDTQRTPAGLKIPRGHVVTELVKRAMREAAC
jgi:hypothetical protein